MCPIVRNSESKLSRRWDRSQFLFVFSCCISTDSEFRLPAKTNFWQTTQTYPHLNSVAFSNKSRIISLHGLVTPEGMKFLFSGRLGFSSSQDFCFWRDASYIPLSPAYRRSHAICSYWEVQPSCQETSFCWETLQTGSIQTVPHSCSDWGIFTKHSGYTTAGTHLGKLSRNRPEPMQKTTACISTHKETPAQLKQSSPSNTVLNVPGNGRKVKFCSKASRFMENIHFSYEIPSVQQIPLLTNSNYLPRVGETFRK